MRKLVYLGLFIFFVISAVAGITASATAKNLASDKIFAISKGGDTSEFPQYSAEAIEGCIDLGFDAVSVEIGEEGISVDELKKILPITKDRIFVILDCTEESLEKAFAAAEEYENVFFRARDMKAKDLTLWAKAKGNKIKIIPSYDGNVIFSAISVYNKAEKNSLEFCEFSSKNRYGVIFSKFFANRFENVKVLSPVFDKDMSGQRNDSLHGWESVIALGYSAIETENAKEFSDYISLLDESYLHLEKAYTEAKKTDISIYSASSTSDFEKHLKNAEEILNSEKPSSQLEINECIENIKLASTEFELSDGTESKTFSVTPMKIFWTVFAIALFLSSQIYLHRKTEKH